MNCQRNINSVLRVPTELSHQFSHITAISIHNHFESPNVYLTKHVKKGTNDGFGGRGRTVATVTIYGDI
jgi:hypothetical protein